MYKFHKKKEVDIAVDLWRFVPWIKELVIEVDVCQLKQAKGIKKDEVSELNTWGT